MNFDAYSQVMSGHWSTMVNNGTLVQLSKDQDLFHIVALAPFGAPVNKDPGGSLHGPGWM